MHEWTDCMIDEKKYRVFHLFPAASAQLELFPPVPSISSYQNFTG